MADGVVMGEVSELRQSLTKTASVHLSVCLTRSCARVYVCEGRFAVSKYI